MNVSEHFAPQLQKLIVELREALPRLATEDPEALHDLRVALRRLRSLLRPLRSVYDRTRVLAARSALKTIGDASSALRDDEVLGELLTELSLPAATRTAAKRWYAARARTMTKARQGFVRGLTEGSLEQALAKVDEVLAHPPKPKRDEALVVFARKVVLAAQRDIEDTLLAGRGDVEGLHELRIAYKRLRYAIEGLSSALAPELVAMREVATKLQKRLGDLHDLDVANIILREAPGLLASHRAVLLEAIVARRAHAIRKFQEDAGPRASTLGPDLARTSLSEAIDDAPPPITKRSGRGGA